MKTYDIFHGYTLISEIGKELRKIIINEKSSFKILTGYGSKTGFSKSKQAALRSLAKIKKEGLTIWSIHAATYRGSGLLDYIVK